MNVSINREQSEFARKGEQSEFARKVESKNGTMQPANYESDMETMRRQMDILRRKLSRQEIVNERMIRQSMRHNMNRINRRHLWLCLLCLIMIPFTYLTLVMQVGFSLLFWSYTTLMMLVVMGYTLYMNLHLHSDDVLGGDLLVAQQQVVRARRLEYDWLKIGLPLLALWIAFVCYEVFRTTELANERLTLLLSVHHQHCRGHRIGPLHPPQSPPPVPGTHRQHRGTDPQ